MNIRLGIQIEFIGWNQGYMEGVSVYKPCVIFVLVHDIWKETVKKQFFQISSITTKTTHGL